MNVLLKRCFVLCFSYGIDKFGEYYARKEEYFALELPKWYCISHTIRRHLNGVSNELCSWLVYVKVLVILSKQDKWISQSV